MQSQPKRSSRNNLRVLGETTSEFFERQPQSSRDNHRVRDTTSEFERQPQSSRDNLRVRETTSEFERQPQSSRDNLRVRETTSEFERQPQSSRDNLRVRETTSEAQRQPAVSQVYSPALSSNLSPNLRRSSSAVPEIFSLLNLELLLNKVTEKYF